jgi:hypothetical protein
MGTTECKQMEEHSVLLNLGALNVGTFPSASLKILILPKARELYSFSHILIHSSSV